MFSMAHVMFSMAHVMFSMAHVMFSMAFMRLYCDHHLVNKLKHYTNMYKIDYLYATIELEDCTVEIGKNGNG